MFQRARRGLILPFLLPPVVLYTLITVIPILATVALSLTGWSRENRPEFVGLLNFRLILTDHLFQNSIWHSIY
jgi:ABC-type sugar transport system permease subunit